MAPLILLLFLLSEAASDLIVETVPGHDVILPCQADDSSIKAVKWSRPDLKPDIVLLYRDGHLNKYDQNPSFKDRVDLVDRDLKDGDVSLILKNVKSNYTGIYKCGVKTGDTDLIRVIRTVRLQVTEPDLTVVTVPGDDVILPCRADDSSIRAVEWTRPDLKPDIVLYYRAGRLNTTDQHPSYKGRVELVDRDLKDGDVSSILKNVNKHDAGTYNCRVITGDTDPIRIIRTIYLQVPDVNVVRVPGQNVTLPCQTADSSIRVVEWTRPDLEPDIVLLYRDGHLDTDDQHPSFKNRVELVDRELKDGDVSLILKNVNINDTGTYECRVKTGDSGRTKRDTNSDPNGTAHLQVSDQIVVREPGDDVILSCQADDSSIRVVEWTRADLKPDNVLLYSDGHLNTTHQHPSFKGRVELVDRDLKDGDVSLILKNVNKHDAGTYECRVKTEGSRRKKRDTNSDPFRLIRTIYLQVPDLIVVRVPGDDVILPCRAANSSIRVVEWTKPDLKPDIVLYYSDGHLNTTDQHPSFKDRVELKDGDLKDGDVSLILKNVNKQDAGIYKCRVITGDSDPIRTIRTTRTVRLLVPDLILVRVPGNNVTLPCQAADSSIRVVKWTRPDLKPDIVLLYRDGELNTTDQHPSFKDRVELVDRDLKDGDVSLILKNVSRHDTGIYECRVKTGDTDPIRTIHLLVTDLVVETVPGDNATLPCQADDSSIRAVEWTRPDLEPDIVLLYSDGRLETDIQHPSFKDRVELVDRDLKDRDVSLILKNVSRHDAGIYKCGVKTGNSTEDINSDKIRIIRIIYLLVPGSEDRNSSHGGRYLGLAAGVLVLVGVVAVVVGVLMYKRHKNKRSGPPADEASADKFINKSQSS